MPKRRLQPLAEIARGINIDVNQITTERFNLIDGQSQPCMLHFVSDRDRQYMPLVVRSVKAVSITQLANGFYSISLYLDPALCQSVIDEQLRTIVCTPILELRYAEALALADRFCLAYRLRNFTVYTSKGTQLAEVRQ